MGKTCRVFCLAVEEPKPGERHPVFTRKVELAALSEDPAFDVVLFTVYTDDEGLFEEGADYDVTIERAAATCSREDCDANVDTRLAIEGIP